MTARKRNATPALRTPEQARQHLRDNGITIVEFARQHKLDRGSVNDALRGVSKGNYGKSHAAAVALGLKRDPNFGTDPTVSRQTTARRSTSGRSKAPAAKTPVRTDRQR